MGNRNKCRLLGTHKRRWEDNVETYIREIHLLIYLGCATAQAARVLLVTEEPCVRTRINMCEIHGGLNGTVVVYLKSSFGFLLLIFIPPLLYTHLSSPTEMSASPDQAAHYHILGI
jgi:hypothetical protein